MNVQDVAAGMRLRNRHTGDETTVKDVDRHESGTWVTINWNQAPGPPRKVGYLLAELLKHWEPIG